MANDQIIKTDNMREGLRMNFDAAVKLLDSAIKSLFLLNGAALVGLPTILGLFQVHFRSPHTIFWLAASFMLGVLCATVASLCGYASAMSCVQSLNNAMHATSQSYGYVSAYYLEPGPGQQQGIASTEQQQQQQLQQQEIAASLTRRAVRLHYVGIGFGVFSLIFFLVGTGIFLYVFASFPLNPGDYPDWCEDLQ